MARRINVKDILRKIDQDGLDLKKVKEQKCWVFTYQGQWWVVPVVSLADMSMERWIYEGKSFVDKVKKLGY